MTPRKRSVFHNFIRTNVLARFGAVVLVLAIAAVGLGWQADIESSTKPGTVVINITSGPEDVFQITTAFHVAEDALSAGRPVVLFFNGRGVNVPVKRLSPDLRLGDERALWVILHDLMQRGAEVLVSRESMLALNMVEGEFIPGTEIGKWGGHVFAKMPPDSVVFTY